MHCSERRAAEAEAAVAVGPQRSVVGSGVPVEVDVLLLGQ